MTGQPSASPTVVVLGRGLPGASSPLLGCFELDQARALAAAGATVIYAALDVRSIRRLRRIGQYSLTDPSGLPVEVLSLPIGAIPARLNQALMGRAWRALFGWIERQHGPVDVVHAHFTAWGAAAARSTPTRPDGTRPRVVVTEHSSKLTAGHLPDDVAGLAAQACTADRVVAVSTALATVLRDRFGANPTVIGNVIDLAAFAPAVADRAATDPVRLISTGNLIARKRMDLLIDGFARLASSRANLTLTIVGDGPDRAALMAQVHRVGLTDRISLPGPATRSELGELYRQHDAFALLSSHETFGVVYAEALAAGLPVLSCRIPGPDDFVDEQVGEWAEPTPDGVADGITRLIDRLPSFDPDVLRQRIETRFSAEAVASQLLEVYRTALR